MTTETGTEVADAPVVAVSQKAQERAREAFLAGIAEVRPQLHRYCSRILGSVFEGEDAVQDTLAKAYFKLPTWLDRPTNGDFKAWLFKVARNRCIDIIRRRRFESERDVPEVADGGVGLEATLDRAREVEGALRRMVERLPPKERACLLLKDMMGFTLAEVADLADTTVGGAKSALHRARRKLRQQGVASHPSLPGGDSRDAAVLRRYVELFNRRDWAELTNLLARDARLEVDGVYSGQGVEAFTKPGRYFSNYAKIPGERLLTLQYLDGEVVLVHWTRVEGEPIANHLIRVTVDGGGVRAVQDFIHSPPYLIDAVRDRLAPPSPAEFGQRP